MPEETSSDKMSKAIAAARGGDPSGLWQAAEGLRPYLETVVENVLRNHLTGRVDPASVVQQALLASIERFPQFNGSTGDEWQQWLAVIARNEASNLLQYWHRDQTLVEGKERNAPPVDKDEVGVKGDEAEGDRRFLQPGSKIGECTIEELIGYGGMGEVYRAVHDVLRRKVAVKVLRELFADDAMLVARFYREVRAQARMGVHTNVVGALHASAHENRPYLVMEYVEGENLHELVEERGPLEVEVACDYIRQAARGLGHAHGHGIVHRDVKPSNILLTSDGVIKIVDLGLARVLHREAAETAITQTFADQLLGSLDFMSPEQAEEPNEADARADLYSLGCTFYFLLTGRPPFAELQMLKKLLAHAVERPDPVRRLRPEVPVQVAAVVDQLLEKSPIDRYQSAEELIAALDEVGSAPAAPSEPAGATSPSLPLPGQVVSPPADITLPSAPVPVAPTSPEIPIQSPPVQKPSKVKTALKAITALLVLVLAVGAAGFLGWWLRDETAGLGLGRPVSGVIDEGDNRWRGGGRYDIHELRVEHGRTYLFTMWSRELHPKLHLRRGEEYLAQNEDAPGLGKRARILWRATWQGDLEVIAASRGERERGRYSLSAELLSDPELQPGVPTKGVLQAGDEQHPSDETYVDRYWLATQANAVYDIRMSGEGFDPHLDLVGDDGRPLRSTSKSLEPAGARVLYDASRGGVVHVLANTLRATKGGRYEINVSVKRSGRLILSQRGSLDGHDLRLQSDNSFYDEHTFPVEMGKTYCIRMRSDGFDTYLLLYDTTGSGVARNDDAFGTNAYIEHRATTTGQLRVRANSRAAGMTGRYELLVHELAEE